MKYCGYCGREIADAALHCSGCGTESGAPDEGEKSRGAHAQGLTPGMRVVLASVAGLQIVLIPVWYFTGEFLDAIFQGGLQVGQRPLPLYSPTWETCLLVCWMVLGVFHLFIAARDWGHPMIWIGNLLHVGFAVIFVLWLNNTTVNPTGHFLLLLNSGIWVTCLLRARSLKMAT